MTELDWHDITDGEVEYELPDVVVDVGPDWIPDQAAEYRGALIRTAKRGWSWWVRVPGDLKSLNDIGTAASKEEALAEVQKVIDNHRARAKLGVTPERKKRRFL